MTEPSTQESIPVLCRHTEKFLAKLDIDGVNLWCKECKMYHTVSWSMLQQSFQHIEQHHPIAIVRTA